MDALAFTVEMMPNSKTYCSLLSNAGKEDNLQNVWGQFYVDILLKPKEFDILPKTISQKAVIEEQYESDDGGVFPERDCDLNEERWQTQ